MGGTRPERLKAGIMRIGRYVLALTLLIGPFIIFSSRGLVENYVRGELLQSLIFWCYLIKMMVRIFP